MFVENLYYPLEKFQLTNFSYYYFLYELSFVLFMWWTIFAFLLTLGNLTSFFIVGLEVLVSTWPQLTQLSSTTLTGILTTISRLSPEHTESVKRTRLVATKHWIYSTHYQLTEMSSQLIQGLYHYQIKFYPVFIMQFLIYFLLKTEFHVWWNLL